MSTSPSDSPVVNVVGSLVALGPLRRELIPDYQRWLNDLAIIRNLGVPPLPMTIERETDWFEAVKSEPQFTVYERESWRPIGNAGLKLVNHLNGTAEFGIVIGEADARGKGYGTETARLVLDYAFTVLGLHNVELTVAAFNVAGIRAYEKAGFREIGRRREAFRVGAERFDAVYMDCLARDFVSPVLARIYLPDKQGGDV